MSELSLPLEALAQRAPQLELSEEALNEIAALALAIDHAQARRLDLPVAAERLIPYQGRTPAQRAAMRTSTLRIVQALILLGWIDKPSADVTIHPAV